MTAPACFPDLMKPATAAACVDMAPSTFRAILPILAAHHGLHVYRVGGPKVSRDNLMCVLAKLRVDGKAISVNKREGIVQIGERSYPIKKGGPRD